MKPKTLKLLVLSISVITMLACSLSPAVSPSTSMPTTSSQGGLVSYKNVSFTLAKELATNTLVGTVPALTAEQNWSPWDIAPEHVKILLDNYAQSDSFHAAEILVYPAQEYAAVSATSVSENIRRLQAISSNSAPLTAENMPSIPFFNAGQVIAAQIKTISFKNGSGVRLVTQYDSGITPITNKGLFYHFQGLTSDGKYYVIAILPTSINFLPPDDTKYTIDTPTVTDFPGYYKPNASGGDFTAYYKAVTDKLEATPAESFSPSLISLDALMESLQVSP